VPVQPRRCRGARSDQVLATSDAAAGSGEAEFGRRVACCDIICACGRWLPRAGEKQTIYDPLTAVKGSVWLPAHQTDAREIVGTAGFEPATP
jgi:hypothetical protein